MARIASTVLVVALLAATSAAFVLTQGLKLEKSPIYGTRVADSVFSPVCGCDQARAGFSFRLRKSDRVDVAIVAGDRVVRTIETGEQVAAGARHAVAWDGRDDAGRVLPEGAYEPRVHLHGERTTTTLPNPIRIDVTPPVVELVAAVPRLISPDGDGRSDRVVVRIRSSEPVRGTLFVDGQRRVLKKFRRTEEALVWNGKRAGRPLPAGAHTLEAGGIDAAGNRAERTGGVQVAIRYVSLGRPQVVVVAGTRFAIRVSADAERVHWRLGPRAGLVRPGTLHLRAPLQKGRFTLTVSANGHAAQAAVFVREPSR